MIGVLSHSHYDTTKVPEGYFLRHHRDTQHAYGGIILCRASGGVVGYIEECSDVANMRPAFTIVFNDNEPRHKMHGYDLSELFVRACAYDRLTSTTKG